MLSSFWLIHVDLTGLNKNIQKTFRTVNEVEHQKTGKTEKTEKGLIFFRKKTNS